MGQLCRFELLAHFAQREAGHMRRLRQVRDLLPGQATAPFRHQRVQRVPVGDPVGLAGKARLLAPRRRSHRGQPGSPLPLLTRGDRGEAVARRQDADRGAVAIGLPQAAPASAGLAGTAEFSHRQRRQCFLDRHVDHAAAGQRCVHAGAGRRHAAEECRLLAHRANRRLRQVVHLAGEHAGDAAGREQGEVARRVLRRRAGLAER